MQGFGENSCGGFGGDAITVKIEDGRWLHLSTDQNHIRVDTTRPLEEQLRQVLKKCRTGWNKSKLDDHKWIHALSIKMWIQ